MKNKNIFQFILTITIVVCIFLIPCHAQEKVTFELEKVAENIYCLYGSGGNIGILKGKDQILLVDAQFARTSAQCLAKIKTIANLPIRYLINTHYHGDHTSGNPILGEGALIISHENCLATLQKNLKPEQTADQMGLPKQTFKDKKLIKVNGEEVLLFHPGPAHTCGDTIVIFKKAKVIHAGDLFFHAMPPYIDVKDGSNTKNWIKTIKMLAQKFPDYKIIPGHGKVTTMKNFLKFASYLTYLREKVTAAIKSGKSRDEAMKSIDMAPYNHLKDKGNFLSKKSNIGWVYDEMTRKK